MGGEGRGGEGKGGLIGNCIKMEFTSASVCGRVHIRTYVHTNRDAVRLYSLEGKARREKGALTKLELETYSTLCYQVLLTRVW